MPDFDYIKMLTERAEKVLKRYNELPVGDSRLDDISCDVAIALFRLSAVLDIEKKILDMQEYSKDVYKRMAKAYEKSSELYKNLCDIDRKKLAVAQRENINMVPACHYTAVLNDERFSTDFRQELDKDLKASHMYA